MRPERRRFVLAAVMLLAEAVSAVFEPYPLAYLIDFLKGDRPDLAAASGIQTIVSPLVDTVALLTAGILVLAMVNSAADSLAEVFLAKGGWRLGMHLRIGLHAHLQRLSLAFHDQRRTGDMLTRLTSDVAQLEEFVTKSSGDLIGSVMVLAGTLFFLLTQSWQVTLLAVAVVPLLSLVSHFFSKRIKAAARRRRAREGDLASAAQEMLTSIRVIQTYSRSRYEEERFTEHSELAMGAALEGAGLEAGFSFAVKLLEAFTTAVVVWLGVWLIHGSAMSVGTLVMFIVLIQNMFKPTRKLIKEWTTVGKLIASLERVAEVFERRPTVTDAPDAVPAPRLRGAIEFRGVSFSYGTDGEVTGVGGRASRLALDDVSFAMRPGQVVALVGRSGAGKSTIAQLLPRLYDPQLGRILVDGLDLRRLTLESLRDQISVVLQDTVLFHGTVADNIAYGRIDANREEIVAAARLANAHEFIIKLPQGYDTIVGERGATLSGGQRQRLAIARAFIRNTPILILDEPTTGLDSESSELVLQALGRLVAGTSTIIISHDLNLVRQADRILVLREGRLVESGTHEALLARNGLYSGLARAAVSNGRQPVSSAIPARDALHSPAVHRELPGLAAAFDGDQMCELLQRSLLDGRRRHLRIVDCRPGKATYVPGDCCIVRYRLRLETDDRPAAEHLVVGRVFGDPAACAAYARQELAPLASRVRHRVELAGFAIPVATLEPLSMAVGVFPIDGDLPTLPEATSHARMTAVLRRALSTANLETCAAEVVTYPRRRRCVLRYEISAHDGDHVVYGKVTTDGEGQRACETLLALRGQEQAATRGRVALPRPLGYDPALRLLLMEPLRGSPVVAGLLSAQAAATTAPATAHATRALNEILTTCGWLAASLHGSDVIAGAVRSLPGEVESLRWEMRALPRCDPPLAAELETQLERAERMAQASTPLEPRLAHGDFTHSQIVFDGDSSGLLDFDDVCKAEPALDLGQFTAYLKLAALKAQSSAEASHHLDVQPLVNAFLDAYAEAAAVPDRRRLRERHAAYERLSLIRIAVHSWHKLKAGRLAHVLKALAQESA
jgi:ABC-type multidrug transport system fused ATPase/permease subunit